MTQQQRVLAMLRRGPCTTRDFLQAGIPRYSARIRELRERGHPITTERLSASSYRFTLTRAKPIKAKQPVERLFALTPASPYDPVTW